MRATWKPHEKHGELTERGDLPDSVFAYPKERKEPMTDASHVRNAVARFNQVQDVPDSERELAFANIKKAAKHYGVDLSETGWHDLGKPATSRKKSATRKKTTRKKTATRKTSASRKKVTARKKTTDRKKTTTRKKTSTRKKTARKKTTRKKPTARKKARKR
jgi:hypothetical protein